MLQATAAAAVLVGAVWGITNPFVKRGSVRAEAAASAGAAWHASWVSPALLLPWLANQCGSVLFVALLGSGADISQAVPVANAVSIAANAVTDVALGEQYRLGRLLPGCALVAAGVLLCTL